MSYKSPKSILGGLAVVLLVIFVLQNDHSARVQLLFWSLEIPLFILLVAMLGVGFGAGWLVNAWRRRRQME